MMVFFVLFFFPRGVLDEILNLIESVSEGFPSYYFIGIVSGLNIFFSVFKIFRRRLENCTV